jgi:hypothetical protein
MTFFRAGRKEEAASQLQVATRLEHDEAQQRRTVLQIQDVGGDHYNSEPKK